MRKLITRALLLAYMLALSACVGDEGFTANDSTTSSSTTTAVTVGTVSLTTDKTTITTGSTEYAVVTALVKDSNNNLISGVDVTFNVSNNGSLEVVSGTTDALGTATANVYATGDDTNRTMTVTATAGGVGNSIDISAIGTTIRLSTSTPSVSLGGTATFTITAENGAGNAVPSAAISVSSASGNAISPSASVTTLSNGTVTVDVIGGVSGVDIITATGLNTAGSSTLSIGTAASFSLTNASGTDIALSTNETVTLTWKDSSGAAMTGKTVNFAVSRGTIENISSTYSAVTDGSGNISFTIQSTNAGPVTISAIAASPETASTVLALNYVATVPDKIDLQPNPSTIGQEESSTLTAVVRDENNNPVKGVNVVFTVDDISSGSISPALATTDNLGRASTVYTSSALPSGSSAVVVTATLQSAPAITTTAEITVAEKAFFISMGTGKTITSLNSTQNAMPFGITVSDINGHGVAGVQVILAAQPIQPGPANDPTDPNNPDSKAYRKGYWVVDTVNSVWVRVDTAYCNNEDLDLNGVLDAAEDTDLDDKLDPGTNVTVPQSVTTDENGLASFNVNYSKEFAYWMGIELYATITTAGTDNVYKKVFWLQGVAEDYSDVKSAVPGEISPFGAATSCADYR